MTACEDQRIKERLAGWRIADIPEGLKFIVNIYFLSRTKKAG
jgi:hypothetical protein